MPAPPRRLVTGAAGMLGSRLLAEGAVGVDPADGDLAEPGVAAALLAAHAPLDGVIHAAGFTDVDGAEARPAEARHGNVDTTLAVAEACAAAGLPLVVLGSDYVFDGRKGRPYVETDAPNPLNAYGRTKLEAERAALAAHPAGTRIVRTQWLYGPNGRHFVGRILALARERSEIAVVADQVGCPTSTLELAPALLDILRCGEPGIYHAACEGSCSWFDLATAVVEEAGLSGVRIVPCTSDEYARPARRPAWSVLDSSKLALLRGRRLAHWREALRRYLALETP